MHNSPSNVQTCQSEKLDELKGKLLENYFLRT